jgi:RNA polymerase sigma-70 factor, ECF subfamily
VIELNRAIAVSRAEGPAAGLALLDALATLPGESHLLQRYAPFFGARADVLERLGRLAEATTELRRAAALTENLRVRSRLLAKAERLAPTTRPGADEPS